MSWETVHLGDFLKVRDDRFKPNDKMIEGLKRVDKIDFSGQLHLSTSPSKTDMILVKNGDLLISGINVYKGAVIVYEGDEDITATIHYSSYKYDKTRIDVEFLKLFLKSPEFLDAIKEQVSGGIKTEIKPKHLLPLKVVMPDLNGQIEVVKSFSKVDAKQNTLTTELTHQLDLLRQLRQSFLREAMQGKLVEQDPKDEPASELLKKIKAALRQAQGDKKVRKQKELPPIKEDEIPFAIPDNWVWCIIPQFAANEKHALKAGPFGSSLKKEFYVEKGYKIYGQEQVINQDPFFGNYYIDEVKFQSLKSCQVKPGDILISLVGTMGKVLILPEVIEDGIINPRLVKVSLYPSINREFIRWFLYSPIAIEQIQHYSHGSTMDIINLGIISRLLIPLPPLPEQHRIVAKLEQIMQLCDDLEQSIRQSKEQTNMLLQAALREALQPKGERAGAFRHNLS